MKKWIIILFIICGIGTITAAALAGHIYFKGMKQAQHTENISLDASKLKNIVLDTAIPVKIKRAQDDSRIEITEHYRAYLGEPYKYSCNVESKDNQTIITIRSEEQRTPPLFIKDDYKEITIYLPDQAIDSLNIINNQEIHRWYKEFNVIDLQDINIKNLEVHSAEMNIDIKGKCEKINITAGININIQADSMPKEINIADNQGTVTIILPTNIKGIELKTPKGYSENDKVFTNQDEELNLIQINSDFALEEKEEQGERIYTYGDGTSTKIQIDGLNESTINLLDGNYSVK